MASQVAAVKLRVVIMDQLTMLQQPVAVNGMLLMERCCYHTYHIIHMNLSSGTPAEQFYKRKQVKQSCLHSCQSLRLKAVSILLWMEMS